MTISRRALWGWLAVSAAMLVMAVRIGGQETRPIAPTGPGTGPYAAIAESDPGLPGHVVYRPRDLTAFGAARRLPLVAWANGGCANTSEGYRPFLAEIASHGFLVLAIGPMTGGTGRDTRSSQLLQSIGWATGENARAGSPYQGKLDPSKVAVMGHSCGGLQALEVAADPRITTTVLFNSGVLNTAGEGPEMPVSVTKATLDSLRTPIAYIIGGPKDIAYPNAVDDVRRIERVPVFMGNLNVGHGGTFREPNGGAFGAVAVAWLEWQLRNDMGAARHFVGATCGLCADSRWTVERKRLPEGQSGVAVTAAPESIQGMLADGSNFRVVKPTPWNGTIVLDLDFANNLSAPPSAIERWMTANGYAIGGISREPVAYRFRQAVEDLIEVRRLFSAKWRVTPARTLTLGNSRGGFVSRIAMERYPDIFKGAVLSAGGGAGEVGTFNAKLDALWTLKVLTGAPLALVAYASQADAMADNGRLTALVKELRSSPAGRARLALAAAFEQFPRWTGGDTPPGPNDYEAQLDQIADQFAFANPGQVRWGVEVVAGGNFSWNHGVDYAALLARSGMADLVEALYATSGLNLQADLRQLAQAPRISAAPAAVAAAESLTSYSGAIGGPVVVVDNIGDPVDADAYKRAYERTVARAGKADLLRTTWVRSARHANQSALEKLAGFVKLVERLDTGRWSATTPQAMLAAAADIDAKSELDLGPARFIDHAPPEMLRPWDGSNWATYAATLSGGATR